MDDCIEKIDHLLKKQGRSQTELLNYLGLSHGTYTHWRKGKSKSYKHNIRKIAKFFKVPVSFFGQEYVDDEVDPSQQWGMAEALSKDEWELIQLLRTYGEESVHTVYDFVVQINHFQKTSVG